MHSIDVIDSHTGGEPTRLIVSGGPDLGGGPLAERLKKFRAEFDHIRRAVTLEPRGSDALVGGLICEPHEEDCCAGVIFFNNVGYLGMCGHGAIGLMRSLEYLGKIGPGTHAVDTPVGKVTAELDSTGLVSIANVMSYRHTAAVTVDVPSLGTFTGDVAYGGNWFFLVTSFPDGFDVPPLELREQVRWTSIAMRLRAVLGPAGITGAAGAEIDHIEFFGAPWDPAHDSRNFVLCPGGAYDRSPCGTGTSAKLACLAADGKLRPGQPWAQESVVGSVFTGSYQAGPKPGTILPTIAGSAFVSARATLILDPLDPFVHGFGSAGTGGAR